MKLELKALKKKFKDKIAVNKVSLSFEPGVYGLLGANGAGKTTLMRIICGILEPTEGEILLDGINIKKLGEKYRNLLGLLPQDFGYYPDFSAREFLLYISSVKGLSKSEAKDKTEHLLDLVGLSNVKNKKIRTFSGGMKQRLGIAQAIINDPQILILDEPTAGLDPKERVKFRNLISELSKDKIVILSTHIVSDVEYIADSIIMLKDGEILLFNTADKIVKAIDSFVWKCIVDGKDTDEIYAKYTVANFHRVDSGVEMRVISEDKPCESAENVTPTLEDLYLYYFPSNEPEECK
jgi:ABC-2 type transport system ATP-binding protein